VSLPRTVISGGRLIDPSQGIDAERDLQIADGKVVGGSVAGGSVAGGSVAGGKVAAGVTGGSVPGAGSAAEAEVFDAAGLIVTPGLVDIHTHFFYGMTSMAVDPRSAFAETGVTAAVDAGTSGSANFVNFKTFILEPAQLHLYGFLNLYVIGFAAGPGDAPRYLTGMSPLDIALVDPAAKMIARNPDRLVGVKVLAPHAGSPFTAQTAELVGRAVEIATRSQTRVMCHIDGGADLSAVLDQLRAGDIVTHCFQGKDPNILDESNKIRPVVAQARQRGVLFDFAPADHHHFSWAVAAAAAQAGFWPDTISTDMANPVRGEPAFASLPECMSMLLDVGMPLADVVAAATSRAAAAAGLAHRHGSLAVGRAADVTVLKIVEEPKEYRSMRDGETRTVARRLVPVATMIGGTWLWRSSALSAAA
jgi:dihydroorotase